MAGDSDDIKKGLSDFFKKMGLSWLSDLPNMLMNSIGGMFGGLFGMIAGPLGLTDKLEELKGKVVEGVDDLTARIDTDLANARKGSASAVDQFFTAQAESMGIDETLLAQLKSASLTAVTKFYADGVPALANGRPEAAYNLAINLRKEIVLYLAGDAANGAIGALDPALANRDVLAQQIATRITGVAEGETIITLAAKNPSTGMVGMLSAAQTRFKPDSFVEGSVKETDFNLTPGADVIVKPDTALNDSKNQSQNNANAPKDKSNQLDLNLDLVQSLLWRDVPEWNTPPGAKQNAPLVKAK